MEIVAYKGRPFFVFVDEFLSHSAHPTIVPCGRYVYLSKFTKIQPTGPMSSVLTVLLWRDPPLSFRRTLL